MPTQSSLTKQPQRDAEKQHPADETANDHAQRDLKKASVDHGNHYTAAYPTMP